MTLPYSEGTWFAVPLTQGGYAVGLVARSTSEGEVILCYFFGPRRDVLPPLAEVVSLRPEGAVRVARVGDLGLMNGTWTILGRTDLWRRVDWPMPYFVRRDELSRRAWRVTYSDEDPNQVLYEEEVDYELGGLDRDSVWGAKFAEASLSKILS